MKTLTALTTLLFATTYSSFAGPERYEGKDTKSVVQPVMQQECNWTGFYIGAHVGYGWNDLKWSDTDPDVDGEGPGPEILVEQSAGGVIAGGTIGYNYQFGRHFVLGAEGEFSFSDVSETSHVSTESFTNRFETSSQWDGTFALRLGFACNKFLFYAKGGGAVTHQEYSLNHTVLDEGTPFPVDRFNADQTWVSPLVGAGVEYMINCHWSVKAEYTCLFLGKDDISGTNVEASASGAESESYEIDLKHQNTVRVGLNYKF